MKIVHITNAVMLTVIMLWISFWSIEKIVKDTTGYRYDIIYIHDDSYTQEFYDLSNDGGEIINARRAQDKNGNMGYEIIIKKSNWN